MTVLPMCLSSSANAVLMALGYPTETKGTIALACVWLRLGHISLLSAAQAASVVKYFVIISTVSVHFKTGTADDGCHGLM